CGCRERLAGPRADPLLRAISSLLVARRFRRSAGDAGVDPVCAATRACGAGSAFLVSPAPAVRLRRLARTIARGFVADLLFWTVSQRPHVDLERPMAAGRVAESARDRRGLLRLIRSGVADGTFVRGRVQ